MFSISHEDPWNRNNILLWPKLSCQGFLLNTTDEFLGKGIYRTSRCHFCRASFPAERCPSLSCTSVHLGSADACVDHPFSKDFQVKGASSLGLQGARFSRPSSWRVTYRIAWSSWDLAGFTCFHRTIMLTSYNHQTHFNRSTLFFFRYGKVSGTY